MAYATLAAFRRFTHFTVSDISDTDVTAMIADADRAIVRLTTTEVYLERLEGNIDGSNVDFRTKYVPIADATASGIAPAAADVTVYYATLDDTTGWLELGTAKTVSSIQAETGIITMETAPTTTTAEAGVFAVYRYDSQGVVSNELRIMASCYFLAYMVANKIKGQTPDMRITETPYLRRDLTGADWLKLVFETLGLQDKVFFKLSDGQGIPQMGVATTSGIKDI